VRKLLSPTPEIYALLADYFKQDPAGADARSAAVCRDARARIPEAVWASEQTNP
jgi:hypothetical protein